jgi:uncharacterized protein YdeI (YjbR/CyaY-like superfamily)
MASSADALKPDVLFFATPDDWRQWLAEHHAERQEVWVGLYKRGSGRPSMTWPEAVDQALCFGWIDGVRKSVDADSYQNRFTPRRPGGTWSEVNIRRVEELTALGLMHPAGLAAFQARTPERSGLYSYEQRDQARLEPAHEQQLRANRPAWDFFQAQPPWYRKTATWWIVSAKQEATRLRRLATLIECSALGRTIPPLTRPGK